MKNNLLFVVLFVFTLIVPSAIAQDVPKGDVAAEPLISEAGERSDFSHGVSNVVSSVTALLPDKSWFRAEFTEGGGVTNLSLSVYNSRSYYAYPKSAETSEFANLNTWNKFAQNLRDRFQIISDDLYAELVDYEVLGTSTFVSGSESSPTAVILKAGTRLLAIGEDQWVGSVPETGSKVLLGRSVHGDLFFQVFRAGKTLTVEPAVGTRMAEEKREREARFAIIRAESEPTRMKPIIVTGKAEDAEK
ncbi:MAG: hypothetical protein Q7R88_01725 [bacterium]|nr:hypothetical protein [bacterium]